MTATHAVERHWSRAQSYLRQWQLAPAEAQFEMLRTTAPSDIRTRLLAAEIAWQHDRVRDAAALAVDAAPDVPDDCGLLQVAVATLWQAGETVAAHALLDRPAWRQTGDADALIAYAGFLQDFGEPGRALDALDRIDGPVPPGTLNLYRGQQLEYLGRLDAARAEYLECLRQDPACGRAAYWLARLQHREPEYDLRELIVSGLAAAARGTRTHAAFEFALYHALEDQELYADAWAALERANAEMRAQGGPADGQQESAMRAFKAVIATHAPGPAPPARRDPCPIFIVGLPRSGTTLLERMLSNHSQVATAGELADFGQALLWAADTRLLFGEAFRARLPDLDWAAAGQRYLAQTAWRAQGKAYYVDKQPTNWAIAGFIHVALPQAKIINVVRDPMDVCFSNWRALFGDAYPWVYDFAGLARQHRQYEVALDCWRGAFPDAILDAPYSRLVTEPAAMLRAVFDFCGLAWEAGCEDPRRNAAPVATLSAGQVREPLHRRGVGRWRAYAAQLEPLQRLLQATSTR